MGQMPNLGAEAALRRVPHPEARAGLERNVRLSLDPVNRSSNVGVPLVAG